MTDTKPKPFDFDALDLATAAETPYEFEVRHPDTGDGLGVFVSVIGAESETFQQYLRAEANALRRKAFESQRKGKGDGPVMFEEEEETGLRALAMCVKGWRTVIDGKSESVIIVGGKRLEFGFDNVLVWLRKFRWVRGQINEETASLANFVGNASPASVLMPKPSSN